MAVNKCPLKRLHVGSGEDDYPSPRTLQSAPVAILEESNRTDQHIQAIHFPKHSFVPAMECPERHGISVQFRDSQSDYIL